jgi:lycopene cyclase domain-containing protein
MSTYAWIIILTIAGPFFLSFDKKVHFYQNWRALFPSILLIGFVFLIWDEFFTVTYLLKFYIGHLPIEEILFFLVVPYACVFIYEVVKAYFPNLKTKKIGHYFALGFTLAGLTFGFAQLENWYTASACIVSSFLTIGFYFINRVSWYGNFVIAFLISLIPFLIVNGVLTGAVTDQPIVWYNENHIMGPRIITIPVEDLFYNYSMLLPIFGFYEYFKKKLGFIY